MASSNKPHDTDFKQQRLRAWQPILTPRSVIVSFSLIGIVFIIIGSIVLSISRGVVEVSKRYDDACSGKISCVVNISVPQTMAPPIYMYYELTNYYQNHRRYVKSRSDKQLSGSYDQSGFKDCSPMKTGAENKVLYPCGLIAATYFTDEFSAFIDGKELNWTSNSIAWESDRTKKFVNRPLKDFETNNVSFTSDEYRVLPSLDSEELMVWMRVSGLPKFRKLHRKISDEIPKGSEISFEIKNNYPTSIFSGEKRVALSTTSVLGGKSNFLAFAYLTTGILCLISAVIFGVKNVMSPRALGDVGYFRYSDHTSPGT